MKKLGIYGGAFNPIHLGHVRSAEIFYDEMGLDELHIMPTFISPHKEADEEIDPEYRLEMACLAFKNNERNIKVSDYEINQGGKSYTYLTLQEYKNQYPECEIYFLMGTDMFLCLESWKNPDIIFDLAGICCIRRENDKANTDELKNKAEIYKNKYGARIFFIPSKVTELSSTDVRNAVKDGNDISAFVTDEIKKYIRNNRIYSPDSLYKAVNKYVYFKRRRHIFSTEDEALALADIFELTPTEKEELRASAVLHDLTKAYSYDSHMSYLNKLGIDIDEDTKRSEKTLHQLSGAYLSRELFPERVNDRVFNNIKYHTTGRADMTLSEKLMYLADYIEKTRTFPDCVTLREYFYKNIALSNNMNEKLKVLDDTVLISLEMTVKDLNENGFPVHHLTNEAMEYLKKEEK